MPSAAASWASPSMLKCCRRGPHSLKVVVLVDRLHSREAVQSRGMSVTSSIGQAALLESSCCATRCMRQQASNPHGSQRTRCHYSRTSFTSQMQDMPLGKVTKSPAWRSWVGWQGE